MSDASSAPQVPVVDLVDDGMTDEQIAAQTGEWLRRILAGPGNFVPESAAQAQEACGRDADLWPT